MESAVKESHDIVKKKKMSKRLISTSTKSERAYLVGVRYRKQASVWSAEDSLAELAELTRSAGAFVVGSISQRLDRPTQTYLGKGKIEELISVIEQKRVNTVVCDDELTPTQQRNLENALNGVKVIDRTALILDVFGRRAQSKEGQIQVELAQHEYLLPRLAGQWSHLERLGGGIGTRGPGETQIETDRRLVRDRIQRLKKSLAEVKKRRSLYINRRKDQQIPVVSIVGYTNAGKSTLLNRLTGANVVAEDKLFTTLDPVTRKAMLPSGVEVLLTDTVGFIQKLPPTVVAAFRATLEEVAESSIVIHVVDVSHQNAAQQAHEVDEILKDLGLDSKPQIMVLNKIDLLERDPDELDDDMMPSGFAVQGRTVFTSALSRHGTSTLLAEIDQMLADLGRESVQAVRVL